MKKKRSCCYLVCDVSDPFELPFGVFDTMQSAALSLGVCVASVWNSVKNASVIARRYKVVCVYGVL